MKDRVPGKEQLWNVQCAAMGGGFSRKSIQVFEMSEEKIRECIYEQNGRIAVSDLSTVGTRVGERFFKQKQRTIGSTHPTWRVPERSVFLARLAASRAKLSCAH